MSFLSIELYFHIKCDATFIQIRYHGELDGISVDNGFKSADYFRANV